MGWVQEGFAGLHTLIGLKSREKNLRESIDTTRQLLIASSKLRGGRQIGLQAQIHKVLEIQLVNLAFIEKNRIKIRNWPALFIGFLFTAIFGATATVALIAGGLILTIASWLFYILTFVCILGLVDLYRNGEPVVIDEDSNA